MSKYSNVYADSLSSCAQAGLDELKTHDFNNIKTTLNNTNYLDTSVKSNIITAVTSIENSNNSGSISTIRKKLEYLKTAAWYIKQIQQMEKNNQSLENNRYYWKDEKRYRTNADGEKEYYYVSVKYTNQSVVNQINKNNTDISTYTAKVDELLKI